MLRNKTDVFIFIYFPMEREKKHGDSSVLDTFQLPLNDCQCVFTESEIRILFATNAHYMASFHASEHLQQQDCKCRIGAHVYGNESAC